MYTLQYTMYTIGAVPGNAKSDKFHSSMIKYMICTTVHHNAPWQLQVTTTHHGNYNTVHDLYTTTHHGNYNNTVHDMT